MALVTRVVDVVWPLTSLHNVVHYVTIDSQAAVSW